MTNAERLNWLIRHRGEPVVGIYLCEESKKLDAEIVEETLCHIWAGFYDAYPVAEITIRPVAKQCYALKRDRKIAENRKHYAQVCARQAKGV